jgi:N-methylhydantoinase A
MVEGSIDKEGIERDLAALADELRERLIRDGADPSEITTSSFLDCRYVGQGYELRIPVDGDGVSAATLAAFHAAHEAEYGHAFNDPIEIVNLRVSASGQRPKLTRVQTESGTLEEALIGERDVVWPVDGEMTALPTKQLDRAKLPVDIAVPGPAIVYQLDTTVIVPPNWSATAHAEGPLTIRHNEG